MERVKWRGSTLLSPVPAALVTVGVGEEANVLTVAWCGIVCSQPPVTYISVRPQRHSYGLLKNHGEFVIHLTSTALVRATDYCGVFTGAKVNKFEKCGLTKIPSTEVAVPTIAEAPLALECRVRSVTPLGTHDMFLADILAVTVRDELLDETGKLCLERADLCAYSHGSYYALGRRLGSFGFTAAKKRPKGKGPADKAGKS